MKKETLICGRCDTFVGGQGLEVCPVCGADLNKDVLVIKQDEEKDEN